MKFYALCGNCVRKSSGFTDTTARETCHRQRIQIKVNVRAASHASGIGVNFQDPVFWTLRSHFIYDTSEFIARTLAREICAFPIPNSGGSYGKIICPWQSNTLEFCGWARHKARPDRKLQRFRWLRPSVTIEESPTEKVQNTFAQRIFDQRVRSESFLLF